MGVTGLWKLIEPCGKPVPVETLEGKILAVDISIWLHQAVKGFQDNKGAALNNAHLLGLFHRLCKLMYYRVKPVFVFDGCVPQLKRDTIARRQQQRSKLNTEADRIQALLLQSLAKEKMVQQALGPNAEHLLTSPIKKLAGSKSNLKDDVIDDMFKLPELPESLQKNPNQLDDETTDDSFNESSFYATDGTASASTDDSSFDESNPRNAYSSNLQAIDVRSKDFLQLPADVRHEILVDIKETRKQSSWGRLHELPSHSDDFSTFQMKRLLKRRDVQLSLETAEQEMGGRSLTYAELTNIFTEEGILETDLMKQGTKQISSDEHTRFLLVRDLKKKLTQLKEEKEVTEEELKPPPSKLLKSDDLPSTSKASETSITADNKFGTEYDADLELAIALSLGEDSQVYDEKDYDYNSDESLKLTKDQRYQLQNAAKGPARSYMIEYAGLNKDEVVGIMEKTQINDDSDDDLDIEHLIGCEDTKLKEFQKPIESNGSKSENKINESQEIRLCVTDDSDTTDSDLEEVKENTENATALNIIVDVKNIVQPEDDLFTDIFEDNKDISENKIETEDECVIEETPPCISQDELKDTRSKVLNIEVDTSKPLKPEEDLFADIFENNEDVILPETPSFINDKEVKETKQLPDTNNVEIKNPPKSENILSILDELKQQADEIKHIRLEHIKLSNSIIEISDDEISAKASVKSEVIEICDSDDNKRSSTPPPYSATQQSPRVKTKSPKLRTPSKNHSITEFFDVNYVVKRTPDKPIQEETEVVKVKSPFFIRKTPKSGRKSGSNSPSPIKKPSKANKTLFKQENETSLEAIDDIEKAIQPLAETTSLPNEQHILNQAAELLKSNKTTEELNTIASDLAKERKALENERNRQDRMGMSITQRMNLDCQDLLRLFGVPFIVAPMEAEAQCAFLDIVELTNGTITDDSDIWLFGGRTVYKNFFAQNKNVVEYNSDQIEKDFQCDRKKLIQLACLVGSDYTTGIHGIGAVTALEILASFTSKDQINKPNDPTPTSIQNIIATLQRFRNWWESFKSTAAPPGSSARLALQKKLKNIEMQEGFPSLAVVEAYLTPKVDDNKEAFSWGYPDVESLREFARKTFGWTTSKTDDILMPVIKKLNDKRTQQSIRNYFNVKNSINFRQIKVSKRVKNAIERMSGNVDSDNTPEKPTKAKRAKKTANGKKNKEFNVASNEIEAFNVSFTIEPSCSNQMAKGPLNRAPKRVNIPNKTDKIPQREKDLAQLDENKKQAAEILKNAAKATKKKFKA